MDRKTSLIFLACLSLILCFALAYGVEQNQGLLKGNEGENFKESNASQQDTGWYWKPPKFEMDDLGNILAYAPGWPAGLSRLRISLC